MWFSPCRAAIGHASGHRGESCPEAVARNAPCAARGAASKAASSSPRTSPCRRSGRSPAGHSGTSRARAGAGNAVSRQSRVHARGTASSVPWKKETSAAVASAVDECRPCAGRARRARGSSPPPAAAASRPALHAPFQVSLPSSFFGSVFLAPRPLDLVRAVHLRAPVFARRRRCHAADAADETFAVLPLRATAAWTRLPSHHRPPVNVTQAVNVAAASQ